MKSPAIIFSLSLLLAACATPPAPAERRALADSLAAARGWHAERLPAGSFDLIAYLPATVPHAQKNSGTLTIYIEGDGLAWISGSLPSSDPTPRDPIGLRLALAHPEGAAAYLARPCQFIDAEAGGCPERYWTDQRFAPEVVASSNIAIDRIKQRSGATRINLVGYSGGGAVAALLAARRNDVDRLVTVAGNLDHRAWTAEHRLRPLNGSLNAADETGALDAKTAMKQIHFAGGRDDNITPALVRSFANRFPVNRKPAVRVEADFDHRCCWAERWPALWRNLKDSE